MEQNEITDAIQELFSQQSNIKERLGKIENTLDDIQNTLRKLEGVANPPNRPPKPIEINEIITLVESGKSARTIATMLKVTPNTITSRLEDAGYIYERGRWKARGPETHLNRIKEIIDGIQDGSVQSGYREELERLIKKRYPLSSKALESKFHCDNEMRRSQNRLFKEELKEVIKGLRSQEKLNNVLAFIGEDGLDLIDMYHVGSVYVKHGEEYTELDGTREKKHGGRLAQTARIVKTEEGWKVPSLLQGWSHIVTSNGHDTSCTCGYFQKKGGKCEHIWAIELLETGQIKGNIVDMIAEKKE